MVNLLESVKIFSVKKAKFFPGNAKSELSNLVGFKNLKVGPFPFPL